MIVRLGLFKSFAMLMATLLLAACGGAPDNTATNTGGGTGGGAAAGNNGVVGAVTVVAGATSIVADGAASTVIRATVVDTQTTPISGLEVSFSTTSGTLSSTTATTDTNGIAEITLVSGTVSGTATITANASGFQQSASVNFVPGAVSQVQVSSSTTQVAGGGASAVSAFVTDQFGNPIPTESVTFQIATNGSVSASLDSLVTTTDANGVAATNYTAGSQDGSDVITATTANGTQGNVSITVSTAGGAQNVDSLTFAVGASSLIADASASAVLRATVLDTENAPVAGQTVSFSSSAGTLSAATQTTDSNGVAQVTLTSSTNTGAVLVSASVGGFSQSGSLDFVAGPVASIELTSALSSINPQQNTLLSAVASDANGNLVDVSVDDLTFAFLSVNSGSPSLSGETSTGVDGVNINYTAGSTEGVDRVEVRSTNGISQALDVTVAAGSATIGSVAFETDFDGLQLTADGTSNVTLSVLVTDPSGTPVSGEPVVFTSNFGTLSALSDVTDAAGRASVQLTAGTSPASVSVNASLNGFFDQGSLTFVPGTPSVANSLITASPSTIPADGVSTSEIVVRLIDANGNLVADGIPFTLQTTLGTVFKTVPDIATPEERANIIAEGGSAVTQSGGESFTLTSSNGQGTATLTIAEFPGVSSTVSFGSVGIGAPTNIETTIREQFLVIGGVGANDNTSITISVTDDSDVAVENPPTGTDNVRVSLITSPGGGVTLNNGAVQDNSSVSVATDDGIATVNLQAGFLPGAIELLIEVASDGDFSTPEISTTVPQISIASGPPATIALSAPTTDAITILDGLYSRQAQIIVTDRFGNAVPDDTTINLGVIDSVIVDSATGSLSGSTLNDPSGGLDTTSIVRNNANRFVQEQDRVIITDIINSEDRSRFVDTPLSISNTAVDVQSPYVSTDSNLSYVIGSSLLGSEISSIGSDGLPVTGSARTVNGIATIQLTYPANVNTIKVGCFANPTTDTRYDGGIGSARVITIASSTSSSATLAEERTLCFEPINGFSFDRTIADVSFPAGTTTGSLNIGAFLRDGGDLVRLPFEPVEVIIAAETDTGAPLDFTVVSNFATNENGFFSAVIQLNGGADPADSATVTIQSEDAEIEFNIDIP